MEISFWDSILLEVEKGNIIFAFFEKPKNPKVVLLQKYLLIRYVAFSNITSSDFKLQHNFVQGYIECAILKQDERYITKYTGDALRGTYLNLSFLSILLNSDDSENRKAS